MLEAFTKHGLFDIKLDVKGDLQVDQHHCVEDAGIVLSKAFKGALGDKKGLIDQAILFFQWTSLLQLQP